MGKIKVIIKRPDEEFGHVCYISTSIENLKRTVGGFVEEDTIYTSFTGALHRIHILSNEDGKIQGLEENIWIEGNLFVGTIIIIGLNDGEFADVEITMKEWKAFVDFQKKWGKLDL